MAHIVADHWPGYITSMIWKSCRDLGQSIGQSLVLVPVQPSAVSISWPVVQGHLSWRCRVRGRPTMCVPLALSDVLIRPHWRFLWEKNISIVYMYMLVIRLCGTFCCRSAAFTGQGEHCLENFRYGTQSSSKSWPVGSSLHFHLHLQCPGLLPPGPRCLPVR